MFHLRRKKTLALKIAEGYVPDRLQELAQEASRIQSVRRAIIQNFITVNKAKEKPPPPPKLIKIIAQFVELTKDYSKIFGFKWTPTLATGGGSIQFGKTIGDGVTTKSSGTFSGTISNLFPQLASAKSAGYARMIQQGMIIVKDRTPATINKSSNKPFVLGSGEFQRPSSVNTGFNLQVRPGILNNERIELGVGISVKNGDKEVMVQLIIKLKQALS